MSDTISAVWKAVEEDRDYVVGLTRDIVRIPSVNPKFQADPAINREADVQTRLAGELEALGFGIDRWDVFADRPNLTGEWAGSDERSLILCGHVDVVPVGDQSKWNCDPFGGDIKDGRIWGRGAIDMKAGVAACVAAARAVRKAGIKLDGRLAIHTVVDEEAGGFGAMDLVKRSRLAKSAIIAEPTWGNIVPAEGGLTWVRVTIFGKQAHAGWRFNSIWPQPHVEGRLTPGVNAIELATRFLMALRDFETSRCRDNWHPLVPAGLATINPGVIRGGAGMGPDGTPAIMTNAAIIPDIVTIDLDYKFMPQEKFEDVKAEFENFVHHFAASDAWMRDHPPAIEWDLFGLNFPPMNTPVDAPIVQSLNRRATQAQAKAPVIKGFEAVTDAAHYAGAGVVPVIYGPAGDGFHGDNECVEIESLIETTKVIAAAIIDTCGTA
ncbi:Acetylornithine deacetylase or succinyl-diaminopimelate desuccinylase [Mesorhizobium plurifarium]|uniref:Acetylornithine deacetylase or succinyl-diaminopimelate desuccinylase n=2 Tax=Mesorhizobium TaxID=68287 RepID=A0A090FNB0_MESPL|nr:Acetylornithine deacetylase or succinyl-diaminopimelate desuccinylase [Mesorhizobium plurifarium]